jgi:hypothetical protein
MRQLGRTSGDLVAPAPGAEDGGSLSSICTRVSSPTTPGLLIHGSWLVNSASICWVLNGCQLCWALFILLVSL